MQGLYARRGWFKLRQSAWILLAVSVTLVLCLTADKAVASGPKPGSPNVVLIQVDDLSLRVMGASIRDRGKLVAAMPKTKKLLADKGVTFSRFYANSPICAPSRASMLTGLTTHSHGMEINAYLFGYNAWV